MSSTDLQVHCHKFAGGQPALAFSLKHIKRIIETFSRTLAGKYPDNPHPMMCNAKLPIYGLAYSGFVKDLNLNINGGYPQLSINLLVTVHPYKNPSKVIATYKVTNSAPIDVFLTYSEKTGKLRWAPRTSPLATVQPKITAEAETILHKLNVPKPVLLTYQHEVQTVILRTTSSSFVPLVVNALPPIDIKGMVPWLTLFNPLSFDYGNRYLIIFSKKCRMTIGNCPPVDVIIEPDPKFPYQKPEPVETKVSRAIAAVYLPKSRFIEFVSKNLMPAIMYDTGNRGGIIRWRINGAFGLKELILNVAGSISYVDPWSDDLTLSGTLSTSAVINLSGVARAWVDGPCGVKVGLANASVQGGGRFGADIEVAYRSPGNLGYFDYGATLEARLVVTESKLNPNIDIDAVGWPIDDIISELIDHLVAKEVHKLSRVARQLGKWDMVSIPSWLIELAEDGSNQVGFVIEPLSGVSSVIGITEVQG